MKYWRTRFLLLPIRQAPLSASPPVYDSMQQIEAFLKFLEGMNKLKRGSVKRQLFIGRRVRRYDYCSLCDFAPFPIKQRNVMEWGTSKCYVWRTNSRLSPPPCNAFSMALCKSVTNWDAPSPFWRYVTLERFLSSFLDKIPSAIMKDSFQIPILKF